ncbi:MinD/ParA family ATP-binding protein [Actinomadura oligospora]|uniref:MinD/ParA family ATP-binding protein n=1 Tax=Actinomadura oligospora TaxID=111804 RepID=UPI0004B1698F|nr:MinD/ParA family protein [Actinomadura oligospora]
MTERDWQHDVLRDLGISDTGLVLLGPTPPSEPLFSAPLSAPPAVQLPGPRPSGQRQATTQFQRPSPLAAPPQAEPPEQPVPDAFPEWGRPLPQEPPEPREQHPAEQPEPPEAQLASVDWSTATHQTFTPEPTALAASPPTPPTQRPPMQQAAPGPSADEMVRRVRHGDSTVRRLGHGMRRIVGASAAGDVRDTTQIVERMNRPVPSCRRIVVTSIRGGSGKSTISALVADVIREHRSDRVAAVDADPGLGSLAPRLGVRPTRSLRDLAAARPSSFEETASCLTQTPSGLWVLAASSHGSVGADLDFDTFHTGLGRLGRYFSTTVIDCGAGLVSPLHRDILTSAHAQIFVAPATGDGTLSARAAIDWFARNGHADLLPRTLIVLVSHTPAPDTDLARAQRLLSGGGQSVVTVPFDRHLAAGASIDSGLLSASTREATTRIADESFTHSLAGGST